MKLTHAERQIIKHTRVWDHADIDIDDDNVIRIMEHGFFDWPEANMLDTWRELGLITSRQEDATNYAREREQSSIDEAQKLEDEAQILESAAQILEDKAQKLEDEARR